MNRLKKSLSLLLAVVLCLSLGACGSDPELTGDDWRVSGVVAASGTITHDGESVDVLVTVSESSAAFYRDLPEQILFDSVAFPMQIPDAEQAFNAISFEDLSGDGESDVLVSFIHENNDLTELIWIWDPVQRYVFREDLSTVSIEEEGRGDLIEPEEPVEDLQSSEPYFSRNGLEINAQADAGTYLLPNGVCTYSGLGDGYRLNDCYWEIVKNGDYTHDGIRELHFDAICYLPEEAVLGVGQIFNVVSGELYDAYTGMWLTTASAYDNSSRGDNYYLHTVSWQGNSYLIEFAYSTEWRSDVGDWGLVLTKSYAVYVPADYDGLIFAGEAQPDNYRDCAKRMQLDSISPEGAVLELDTLDPYSSLYFDLCD